jgi:hypothetical protein
MITETFINYMNDNFLFYGIDVSTRQGLLLSNDLKATSYPFFGFLTFINNQLTLVKKIEGENISLEDFLGKFLIYIIYR